ncbi:hypothetical protein H5410_001482 [Solanum commersonii]|uniref:Disease resistance RPP13-like protein 1 n=1 Tax=Solanum commersonii TaxID=4109 RepID=A0A9J6AYW1_SOLCO|nr:hypothetical protein H5410_001482 [Solanum commersonii]
MEIGLAVGGAFLSSALNVLFDRLAPNGDLLNMFHKHKHHVQLFEKLGDILLGLQIVLSDAENKQASNRHVSQWFNKLQSAVDGAENLIEQVNYEALRIKVEGQHQNLAETSNHNDDFFLNIKNKLKDTIKKLEVLEKQIGRLGLKEHFVSTKQETTTPSTSLVDDSDFFGRQNDIENFVGRLLSKGTKGNNLAVVPIVGMGGLGKTTIAKAVYHDERVKNHFGLKAWYCVSEPYDALRITKGLLQEIDKFDSKDVENNLNQLQVKLKESLKGKKFIIVLDDVWNDNYNKWDELRNIFVQGDIGSKIIMTTRNESVTLMMGNEQISMDNLSIEASWSLFKRHAFENMDPMGHSKLEEVEEWKLILRSEIWELRDNDILPALMLSYNDLPAHLKKEQVIHLWIANGLVPKDDEIIEDSATSWKRAKDLICWKKVGTYLIQWNMVVSLRNWHHPRASIIRMEDLGEAQNLYGSVSVVKLQNVVDRREAVKAKMREKNHWSESSSADNSQTERDILDALHPHTNIKQLQITGYRGTKFPNWLAGPLFLKLVQLSLSNCKDCYSLPALGHLSCLKFLSIKGMLGITEVTEEFYCSSSSKSLLTVLRSLYLKICQSGSNGAEIREADMKEKRQWIRSLLKPEQQPTTRAIRKNFISPEIMTNYCKTIGPRDTGSSMLSKCYGEDNVIPAVQLE